MVVNVAFAAAFLLRREKRKLMLLAAVMAAIVLQVGILFPVPPVPADRIGFLVQQNIPILEAADWTKDYFDETLKDLTRISLHPDGGFQQHPDCGFCA